MIAVKTKLFSCLQKVPQIGLIVTLLCLTLASRATVPFTFSPVSFKTTARLQYDYVDTEGRSIIKDDGVRRGWFTVKGHSGNWKTLGRFDASEKAFKRGRHVIDFAASYTGVKHTTVTIGRQKTVFGLNWESGNMALSFAERSATTEFQTFKRMDGVMADIKVSKRLRTWVGSYYRNGNQLNSFRTSYSVQPQDDRYQHWGVGVARYNDTTSRSLEYAAGEGRWHAQSEWFHRRTQGQTQTSFNAEMGWFLTADYRPFNRGVFGRVNPASGKHSWQIVSRYEKGYGNYSDLNINRQNTNSAKGESFGVGVNWYYKQRFATMLSWSKGETEQPSLPMSPLQGEELRLRLQVSI